MTPRQETLFSVVPLSNSLVSDLALEGLFELTWRPSRALDSPCALLPELQRYKDTIGCVALGTPRGGPRTLSRTIYANFDCAIVENKKTLNFKYWGRPGPPVGPPFMTPWNHYSICKR